MAWVGGLAEWQDGDTVYLSIAFTWKIQDAYQRAIFARAEGLKVVCGGPSLAKCPECIKEFNEQISRPFKEADKQDQLDDIYRWLGRTRSSAKEERRGK